MKKQLLLLILFTVSMFPQQLHQPAEILQKLNDSKQMYEISILDEVLPCPDYSKRLNYIGVYRDGSDSETRLIDIVPNKTAAPYLELAENAFNGKNYDSALYYYHKTLEADSSVLYVITYIGQIYEIKKQHDKAVYYYKKSINKNFFDYMPHWFLADTYHTLGDLQNAVEEIATAIILNRNNANLTKSYQRIMDDAGRDATDWCFNPQYTLSKTEENKIRIASKDIWLGYALAKALWQYEPGYSESQGVGNGKYSTLEEKECVLQVAIAIQDKDDLIKENRQFQVLQKAVELEYFEEYIFFEIMLPQYPRMVYFQDSEVILKLKRYLLTVRNPQMKEN